MTVQKTDAARKVLTPDVEPASQTFELRGFGGMDTLSIPPEDTKVFSMWCRASGISGGAAAYMKAVSDFFRATQTESSETADKVETDFTKQISPAADYMQRISSESKPTWCGASLDTPWGGGGNSTAPALILAKTQNPEFANAVSETQIFCGNVSAWVKTIRETLPQKIGNQIRAQAVLNGGKLSAEERTVFDNLLNHCVQSFAITCDWEKDVCTVYNLNPLDVCTAAMEMVAPPEEIMKPEPSNPWSWPPEASAKEPSGPINTMREEISNHLRYIYDRKGNVIYKDMGFWGTLEGYCGPVVNRPWHQKIKNIAIDYVLSAAYETLKGFIKYTASLAALTFLSLKTSGEKFIVKVFLRKLTSWRDWFGLRTPSKRVWRFVKKIWHFAKETWNKLTKKDPPNGPQGGSPTPESKPKEAPKEVPPAVDPEATPSPRDVTPKIMTIDWSRFGLPPKDKPLETVWFDPITMTTLILSGGASAVGGLAEAGAKSVFDAAIGLLSGAVRTIAPAL